ncbi:MAG: GNAT family N-acetyltransferase [Lachnospiraceae bacterium]|nr:GNAT family N-acetyltransferase [Lachnospiraceae bacterium]
MKTFWAGTDRNKLLFFKKYAACYGTVLPEHAEICIVTDDGGDYGGFAAIVSGRNVTDIVFIEVPEKKRRQGFGSRLLEEIEVCAGNSGIGMVRCIIPLREDLRLFFIKAGYDLFETGAEYAVSFGALDYSPVYRKNIAGKEPVRARALDQFSPEEREILKEYFNEKGITYWESYDRKLSAALLDKDSIEAVMLCEEKPGGVIVGYLHTDKEHPEHIFDCFRVLDRALSSKKKNMAADYRLSFGTGHELEKELLTHIAGGMLDVEKITREAAAVRNISVQRPV